jgi:hypothetical protein
MDESTTTTDAPPEPAFSRDRLLDLVDGLERDIALVEEAMEAMELGNELSVDAALAALATVGGTVVE